MPPSPLHTARFTRRSSAKPAASPPPKGTAPDETRASDEENTIPVNTNSTIDPDALDGSVKASEALVKDVAVSGNATSADNEQQVVAEQAPAVTVAGSSASAASSGEAGSLRKSSMASSQAEGSSNEQSTKPNTAVPPTPPPAALEPKVQAPFVTRPGEVPREVMVERFKRLYVAGASELDVLWANVLRGIEETETSGASQTSHVSLLPLALFDDKTLETRDPHSVWLDPSALAAGVRCRVASCFLDAASKSKSFVPKKSQVARATSFLPGILVAGDASADTYDVKLARDGCLVNGVPRIDICFETEDPRLFVARRAAAFSARAVRISSLPHSED